MISKLDKRRNDILTILSKVPISSTQQLAEEINVSSETIRKDLDFLAEEGLILKVHGGVALAGANVAEIPFDLRTVKNAEAKKAIAKKAIALIDYQEIIILESCTTNLELAKELDHHPELLETLTIITNSFSIASIFDGGKKCKRLFFLGGWVNTKQYSCKGTQTTNTLNNFHVSKAFLSGVALSDDFILSGFYEDDVAFQKATIKAAHESILLLDYSKFNKTAIFSIAPINAFDTLITNKILSEEEQEQLFQNKVNYIQA